MRPYPPKAGKQRFSVSNTIGENLQRVWPFRWVSPTSQTVFQIDFAELERVHDEAREQHDQALAAEFEPPIEQVDLPYPGIGRLTADGRPQRGGRIDRKPPELTLLAGCAAPHGTRLEIPTGYEDATDAKLAQRVIWAVNHRGRPGGLRPDDYAAQRELTVARSLTWAFFKNCVELPGAPIAWQQRFGGAATILGFLLWARRLGRSGITASGPQWAAILPGRIPGKGCAVSTVWAWMQLLERRGYLIRLRRYKPGRGGNPVALTANWYALGPRALADLGEVRRPTAIIRRRRAAIRRRHLAAEGRRRGVNLLKGGSFPTVEVFAEETLAAYELAQVRDEARVDAFRRGEAPADFTVAQLPAFVIQLGELASPAPVNSTPAPGRTSFEARTGRTRRPRPPRATPAPASTRARMAPAQQAPQREPVARSEQEDRERAVSRIHGEQPITRSVSYPIRLSDEPPLECLKTLRTGPGARGTSPPPASPEQHRSPTATHGPLIGPDSTAKPVFHGSTFLARLPASVRAACAVLLGQNDEFADTGQGDAHTPHTRRDLRAAPDIPLDLRAMAEPRDRASAGASGPEPPRRLKATILDD